MALDRLAVSLSIVAAAAAGYAAWTAAETTRELRAEQEQNASTGRRLAEVEAALAAARTAATAKPPALAEPVAAAAGLAGRAPAGIAPGGAPDVETRLAALERSEAELRKAAAGGGVIPGEGAAGGVPPALPQIGDAPLHFEMPKVYGSAEDAAKDLDLSPSQKAEFERTAADAKREMQDLKKIPDDTGKTWSDVSKETFQIGESGAFTFDTSKLRDFREKTVPGRSESFGAAEKRIRDSAKSRLRSSLTPDQQGKFDKAMVDPMIGASGNGDAGIVFSSVEITAPTPSAK